MFNTKLLVKELTAELNEFMGGEKFESVKAAKEEAAYIAYAWSQQQSFDTLYDYSIAIDKTGLNGIELENTVSDHLEGLLKAAWVGLVDDSRIEFDPKTDLNSEMESPYCTREDCEGCNIGGCQCHCHLLKDEEKVA